MDVQTDGLLRHLFAVPLIRAFFIQRENKAIARRNAIRKVRAKEALLMCVKACEEKRDLAERKQKRKSVFTENGPYRMYKKNECARTGPEKSSIKNDSSSNSSNSSSSSSILYYIISTLKE